MLAEVLQNKIQDWKIRGIEHLPEPHGQQGHASAYERPVRQSSAMYGQQQAVRTPQAERPVSPRLDFGTTTQRETTGTATRRPMGGTTPTLDTPRTPTSKVKEQSIKIPDFFKK